VSCLEQSFFGCVRDASHPNRFASIAHFILGSRVGASSSRAIPDILCMEYEVNAYESDIKTPHAHFERAFSYRHIDDQTACRRSSCNRCNLINSQTCVHALLLILIVFDLSWESRLSDSCLGFKSLSSVSLPLLSNVSD